MEKKNNFISIIALGSFNPAILTPTFLREKCEFKSESSPKGQTTPVVSSLDFDNISFLMELEKFQIMEKNPRNFNETGIIHLIIKYLDILSYTPIYVMGLNLNMDVKNTSNRAISNLNNKSYLLDVFDAEELIYDSKIKYSKDSTINYLSWDLLKKKDTISRMTINLKNDTLTINYNIEIRDIDKDREKICFLDKNLDNINLQFQKFIETIF